MLVQGNGIDAIVKNQPKILLLVCAKAQYGVVVKAIVTAEVTHDTAMFINDDYSILNCPKNITPGAYNSIVQLVIFQKTAGLGFPGNKGGSVVQVQSVSGCAHDQAVLAEGKRSEENTSELQSLNRSTYDVICLKKRKNANE